MSIRRRDVLKSLGAMAGTAYASKLLSACGDNIGAGRIDTLVFMMMENRSYDHYLGPRAMAGLGGDGLNANMSNLDHLGQEIKVFQASADIECVANDPPHGWNPSRVQYAEGKNSGFVLAQETSHGLGNHEPMSYLSREQIPVTNALADAYTSCDRWFSSLLGPTLPNRMYWHAGQSNGAQSNDEVLAGAFKGVRSIYHQLDDAGVDWAYYFGDVPVIGVLEDINLDGRLRRYYNQFIKDAADGELPPVVYIDPAFGANDDHPPHHPLLGQQLIAATYQALATSPHWENCLLVITYDENGGFFDHVPPPKADDERADQGFDQLGFRVPTIVAGPYAKQSYISSVQYDHTSAIRHIQNAFALPTDLTMRTAGANDLADCIDFERLEAGKPAPPITLPAVEIDESELPDSCFGETDITRVGYDHDILEWADKQPELFARWDARAETMDTVYGIADYLRDQGLGGIRRGR